MRFEWPMQGQMPTAMSLRRLLRVAMAWLLTASPAGLAAGALEATDRNQDDRLRRLAVHVQSSTEQERAALARELHDELGSVLTALSLDCSQALGALPASESTVRGRLVEMNALIDQAMGTMTRVVSGLRPQALEDVGLVAAIEGGAREFQQRTGIACLAELPPDDIALDAPRATALFRVFQESLTNVARHAQASRVVVSLNRQRDLLLLEVRDNGCGISRRAIAGPTSYGILGMRERVELLHGTFQIDGTPGRGTRVRVTMPAA